MFVTKAYRILPFSKRQN